MLPHGPKLPILFLCEDGECWVAGDTVFLGKEDLKGRMSLPGQKEFQSQEKRAMAGKEAVALKGVGQEAKLPFFLD